MRPALFVLGQVALSGKGIIPAISFALFLSMMGGFGSEKDTVKQRIRFSRCCPTSAFPTFAGPSLSLLSFLNESSNLFQKTLTGTSHFRLFIGSVLF
jgi:hypothetical protein